MPILIPTDIETIDKITLVESDGVSNCTAPQGHCFGSDGGSGIPENMKVAPGREGEQEVWTLSPNRNKIDKKEVYNRCQYCLKYSYSYEKTE